MQQLLSSQKLQLLLFALLFFPYRELHSQKKTINYRPNYAFDVFSISRFWGAGNSYNLDILHGRYYYIHLTLASTLGRRVEHLSFPSARESKSGFGSENPSKSFVYYLPFGFYYPVLGPNNNTPNEVSTLAINTCFYLLPRLNANEEFLNKQHKISLPRFIDLGIRYDVRYFNWFVGYRFQLGNWRIDDTYNNSSRSFNYEGLFFQASFAASAIFDEPDLDISSIQVIDRKFGNGNSVVDMNEKVEIVVAIRNKTDGTSNGARAILTISDPNIYLWGEREKQLGDIFGYATKEVTFVLEIKDSYTGKPELPIWLELTDASEKFLKKRKLKIELNKKDIKAASSFVTLKKPHFEAKLEGEIPPWLLNADTLTINGKAMRVNWVVEKDKAIQFLGDTTALQQGLNVISQMVRGAEKRVTFWQEEQKLIRFNQPYKHSYAILVAIDDYDRTKDSKKRGKTGYQQLTKMIENANELARALQGTGFPKENIITLYNEKATSTAIEDTLQQFWLGGNKDVADRLFFYFGGHGDTTSNSVPYLVTYDHDRKRPTSTSLLMRDLTNRHSENIKAKHMLIALEACHSGLSIKSLDMGIDEKRAREFKNLGIIRRDTENIARNVLVAGTGEQRALWENGGIFTTALIRALEGNADYDKNGILQFHEIGLFVANQVTAKANSTGVRQDPKPYILDRFGNGSVIFLHSNN